MAHDSSTALGEEVARFRKAWRHVLTAYDRYWDAMPRDEAPIRTDSDDFAQARASLAQWKRDNPNWSQELDLGSVLIGPDVMARTTQVLVPPHEDPDVRRAVERWVGVLHGGSTDPFRPAAAGYDIDSPRIKVGTLRLSEEAPNQIPETFVTEEFPVYEEVPVSVLKRTELTSTLQTPFANHSDDQLRDLYEASMGQAASEADLAALRRQTIVTRKPNPEIKSGSLSMRDYNRLRLPPFNFARLAPTPFNLIRYYHAPGVTEAEQARVVLAVAGWMAAVAKRPFVTRDETSTYYDELPSYVAEMLVRRFHPPHLIVLEAHSPRELAFLTTGVQPYASAFVAKWNGWLFQETVNAVSRDVFPLSQQRLMSGSQNGDGAEVENQPAPSQSPAPQPPELPAIEVGKARFRVKQSPHSTLSTNELIELLAERLRGLTPTERQVYELRYTNKLRYRDIAEAMNISIGSVKTLVSRVDKRVNGEANPSRAFRQESKSNLTKR